TSPAPCWPCSCSSSSSCAVRPVRLLGRRRRDQRVRHAHHRDNMTDHYNVALTTSTPICAAILVVVFAAWYAVERPLSIHSIVTTRREAFYWLAILFTFALGTAAGDLSAEQFNLGYGVSIAIFGGMIALI